MADDIVKKIGKDLAHLSEEEREEEIIERVEEHYGLTEVIDFMLRGTGMSYEVPYDWDNVFIGLSWCSIKDDETGAQFKQRIKDGVKDILGEECECDTHSGEYAS